MKFLALIGSVILLAGCQHATMTEHFASPRNPVAVSTVRISHEAPTNAVLLAKIFCNDVDSGHNMTTLKKRAAALGANLLVVNGGDKTSVQMEQQTRFWAVPSTWGSKTDWEYRKYELTGDAFFVP